MGAHTHTALESHLKKHTNTHTPHKLKLKINFRWSTNQLLHMCWVSINSGEFPPSPNSNSTCLGEDECITFYISHPLLFSIKLTRNGAVSSANWQNWAWFNPVAGLCGWKSYSSMGGRGFLHSELRLNPIHHTASLLDRPGNPSPVTRQGQDVASIVGIYI